MRPPTFPVAPSTIAEYWAFAYPPRESWDRRPVSIDYYKNYMTNFHDNAFEIDGSMHNIRVMMINSEGERSGHGRRESDY